MLFRSWQIDYPPPGVTPPVTDIGGGIRKGIRYIPPAYYREKKKEVIPQEVEVSVITEVAEVPVVPELRNPVIGLAFRDALAKVNVKVRTETIPQSVIEALSVPLPKFSELPEKVIEVDLLETSKLEALIEEDDEVISIYYLMNI